MIGSCIRRFFGYDINEQANIIQSNNCISLLDLCRKKIENILDLAGCKILSEIKNEDMTAYLLRYKKFANKTSEYLNLGFVKTKLLFFCKIKFKVVTF